MAKSPFPGMDPYLEGHWLDVHQSLVVYARDYLRRQLPRSLRARIEERVFLESDDNVEYRTIRPDIRIVEYPDPAARQPLSEVGVAVAEPIRLSVRNEPISQGYIEIIDATSGNRVVTVIELVSPSNKIPGEGRELYLQKQREVILAGASLVEIDLTRTGPRSLVATPNIIPPQYRATYMTCITRGWKTDSVELFPISLRERLPVLPIPLRQTDADVRLDLQPLVEQCYENGSYDDTDYRKPPIPPLEEPDAAWADEWLRNHGAR